jgi:hypothetical protein
MHVSAHARTHARTHTDSGTVADTDIMQYNGMHANPACTRAHHPIQVINQIESVENQEANVPASRFNPDNQLLLRKHRQGV